VFQKIREILKNKLSRELIVYIIAGVLTTMIDWVVTFLLDIWLTPTVSNVIAITVSVIFAYAVNSRWVFETKPDSIMSEIKMFTEFVGARVVSSVIQILSIFVFVEKLGFSHFIIKVLTSVFVIVFNYVVSKLWIFKNKGDRE